MKIFNQNISGEKVYILAKDIDSNEKKKIWNQSQKISAWKRPIFWVALNQQLCPKRLDSFTKYLSVYKILDSEKISLFP